MNVLLIDNYDSFTYNLYQYLAQYSDVKVVRNSKIPMSDIESSLYTHIVISPGPGDPTNSAYFGGNTNVIKKYYRKYPILGVCLGHQGIGSAFGAKIVHAPTIKHGKISILKHQQSGLLKNLPVKITVMRYHSLVVDRQTLPDSFHVDAVAEDGSIMAMHHKDYPLFGIQFHPESFRTVSGMQMIQNFLLC